MRLIFLLFAAGALSLGGCAPDRQLSSAQLACTAPSVLAEIDCMKRRLEADNWRRSSIAESIGTYIAYADAVAERVRVGRLSDANARQDLRTMLLQLRGDTQSTHPYFFYWLWPA